MIKKALVLAAAGLFSLNASAGYVQYDFNGPVHGFVIQHDEDQSIAFYRVDVPANLADWAINLSFYPIFGEGADVITSETTYFRRNGPTNFSIFDDFGGDRSYGLSVNFSRAAGGNFAYTAEFGGSIYADNGDGGRFHPISGNHSGTVTKGVVDAGIAQMLDSNGGYYDGVYKIIPKYIGPAQVPEPGSIALLAIGALGAASAARRRKTSC